MKNYIERLHQLNAKLTEFARSPRDDYASERAAAENRLHRKTHAGTGALTGVLAGGTAGALAFAKMRPKTPAAHVLQTVTPAAGVLAGGLLGKAIGSRVDRKRTLKETAIDRELIKRGVY